MIGWVSVAVFQHGKGGHPRLHHDPTCGLAADPLVPIVVTEKGIWPRRSHASLRLPWCLACFEPESPGRWADRGACVGASTSVFFPERGCTSAKPAKAICAACPVLDECREYALRAKPPLGIWGGTTERERRRGMLSSCATTTGTVVPGNRIASKAVAQCAANRTEGTSSLVTATGRRWREG